MENGIAAKTTSSVTDGEERVEKSGLTRQSNSVMSEDIHIDRPLLLLSAGRSGSSMVAGILAAHGIWTGNCRPGNQYNPKGFFENTKIKNHLASSMGRDWLKVFANYSQNAFGQEQIDWMLGATYMYYF